MRCVRFLDTKVSASVRVNALEHNQSMFLWLTVIYSATLFLSQGLTMNTATSDEGMWLFNDLPRERLLDAYGFDPSQEWIDHLSRSSVRFNSGGSASFISPTGLVLTNHHVGADTLAKLSTEEHNLLENGFLARTHADELKAPDLELNQLLSLEDVTDLVQKTIHASMTPTEALAARRETIAQIEKQSLDATGLRSNVITLYGGARYHLYRFRKYTDVRLVWAPESAIAFFGGDADNFEYPRFCLDACIFRVWESGKPAQVNDFLTWSSDDAADGELVFVSGNPGRTNRIYTAAALKQMRDVQMPYTINNLRRQEILLQQFSLRSVESARRARDDLFGVQNSRKARFGMLAGLQDPQLLKAKQESETDLLEKLAADEKYASLVPAWHSVAESAARRTLLQGKGVGLSSRLFGIAHWIVQMVQEDQKPSGSRLPEFADAGRESMLLQLYSEAPIHADLDEVLLGDSIAKMVELRGGDDPLCQNILGEMSPGERASTLITGTTLGDVAVRRKLVASGLDGINASKDPLIEFALLVDPEIRRFRTLFDELDEQDKQAYAHIAKGIFAIRGTSTYPDATFSLRLAYGTVASYEQDGKTIPAWTTFEGIVEHERIHADQPHYTLPESWKKAFSNLHGSTPFNFVCTADIIGGNSGSPVVNRKGQLVGLIFDGNIQSLTSNVLYSSRQARAVAVASRGLLEALSVVYKADHIVQEMQVAAPEAAR